MFRWLGFKSKKTDSEVQKQLNQIITVLFPPMEKHTDVDGNVYQTDRSIDTNLNSILYELQDGVNDIVIHTTINNIIDRLTKIRKIADVYPELDSKTKYVIIDNDKSNDSQSIS